jgi:hypothetical protein
LLAVVAAVLILREVVALVDLELVALVFLLVHQLRQLLVVPVLVDHMVNLMVVAVTMVVTVPILCSLALPQLAVGVAALGQAVVVVIICMVGLADQVVEAATKMQVSIQVAERPVKVTQVDMDLITMLVLLVEAAVAQVLLDTILADHLVVKAAAEVHHLLLVLQ